MEESGLRDSGVTAVLDHIIKQLAELRPVDALGLVSETVDDLVRGVHPVIHKIKALRHARDNLPLLTTLLEPLYLHLAKRQSDKERVTWFDLRQLLGALCYHMNREARESMLSSMEEEVCGGGSSNSAPEHIPIDFVRFVAAVRATLYFDSFYRCVEAEFLKQCGDPNGTLPLNTLLDALFPDTSKDIKYVDNEGSSNELRERLQRQLDIAPEGGTLVKCSALVSCVFELHCRQESLPLLATQSIVQPSRANVAAAGSGSWRG